MINWLKHQPFNDRGNKILIPSVGIYLQGRELHK